MTTTAHVPQLRFPEFSGEWVEKTLGEIATIKSGSTPLRSNHLFFDGGTINWVKTTDLNNAFIFDTEEKITSLAKARINPINTVLVAMYGGFNQIGRTGLLRVPAATNQAISVLNTYEDKVLPLYLLTWLNAKVDIWRMFAGSSRKDPNITGSDVAAFPIKFPTLPEQTKIASFLSAVDTKIDQLTQKKALLETYKKGAMQQIFSQQIRFTPDEGGEYPEWEEKKLGEVLDYLQPTPYLVASTEYDDSYDTPVLTAGKTFILGYTNEKEGIFSKNLPVIIFDDFTTDSKYVDFEFKAKSSAMKILVGKSDISVKFVFEAMQQIKYEVGGHGRHWISVFSQMMMLFPCPEEQTKIANFLSAIDRKIDLVSQQLEQVKAFKKGLLQQMFV